MTYSPHGDQLLRTIDDKLNRVLYLLRAEQMVEILDHNEILRELAEIADHVATLPGADDMVARLRAMTDKLASIAPGAPTQPNPVVNS